MLSDSKRGELCPLAYTNIFITAFKNCFRCGREFRVCGTERICGGCRKPRMRVKNEIMNSNLSLREKQVVALVRQAKLNKEIAHDLHLTEGTVKEYMNRIFRKLEVKNRTELALWALNHRESPREVVVI
jgi:DNA-binding CsgD family transcriptional regulator